MSYVLSEFQKSVLQTQEELRADIKEVKVLLTRVLATEGKTDVDPVFSYFPIGSKASLEAVEQCLLTEKTYRLVVRLRKILKLNLLH